MSDIEGSSKVVGYAVIMMFIMFIASIITYIYYLIK
jgi:hypothetical protein